MIDSHSTVLESAQTRRRSRAADFVELTKPRLTLLSVMTTLAGFYVGTEGEIEVMRLVHTLLGTFMVGSACGVLNMVIEREHDVLMRRTMTRPLPAGRMNPTEAFLFGGILGIGGIVYLALAVNLLAAVVAAVTLVTYVFMYTPLKRRSTLNTVVGGIPGALPPVIGWVAVQNELAPGAWALFAILFFWQMPHFLALAWMYRRDYERAGYKMLPVVDESGSATSRQILLYTSALLPTSLVPTLFGVAGAVYFFGALLLGIAFLAFCAILARTRKNEHARWLFLYSLLYLPLLLLVMVLDRGGL